jgi:hypothetical protein
MTKLGQNDKAKHSIQKLYEQTPMTDRYARARILSGLKKSKSELAKTQAEYDKFKEYKARTAISK